MLIDSLLRVSAAQAVTASAVSTSSIDLQNPTVLNQIGTGEPLCLVVTVDVAADHTTGDETYEIDVISDDDSALGSPTFHVKYPVLFSDLTAGKRHVIPLPQGIAYQRYLGAKYTTGGTTPTVTLTAEFMPLSLASIEPVNYAKGFSA